MPADRADRLPGLPPPAADVTGQGLQHANRAWWDEDAGDAIAYPAGPAAAQRDHHGEIIPSTQILAIVGDQPIIAGDLLGRVNEALKPFVDQVPAEELDKKRWELVQQLLPSAIEAKAVFLDFQRSVEPQQLEMIRASIYGKFDEEQLPKMIELTEVDSIIELEEKLRQVGSSLEKMRRAFFEQAAAREMIKRHTGEDDEVTHDQLLGYYREHLEDYRILARARWEQLMVKCPRGASDAEAADAYRRLGEMGNRVLNGAPLPAVAQRYSEGFNAASGGQHDWTTQGSLVSEVLDQAIFSLPIGSLSTRLRDDEGFHIIRVLERQNAGFVSFKEAQVEIRKQIQNQRRQEKVERYIERLRRETPVWNYFEQEPRTAAVP